MRILIAEDDMVSRRVLLFPVKRGVSVVYPLKR